MGIKLKESDAERVEILLNTIDSRREIAKMLGVTSSTLYKYLNKHLPNFVGIRGNTSSDEDLHEGDIWILGYEGVYAVNCEGQVISYRNNKRKILKGGIIYDKTRGRETYKVVCLQTEDKKTRTEYVHRLVAKTLLPNPQNLPCVNHKNLDKFDNRVDNLEWVSFSENTAHGYEEGAWDESLRLRKEQAKKKAAGLIDSTLFKDIPNHYREYLTEEDFINLKVPPEIINFSITRGDFKSQWKFFVSLFRDCDNKDLTLSYIAKRNGIDESYVCYIRKGVRMKKARKMYEKYKDNKYYIDYI